MSTAQQQFEPTPLNVLIIGAGLSGIGAARALTDQCPDKRYLILERRAAMGGTWDLFQYPGIRSDSDMYTLSYSYKPWTHRKAIADGADIKRYIEDIAEESGITSHIRFQRKVVSASWSSEQALWTVTSLATDSQGQEHEEVTQARLLSVCAGYYSYDEGYRPDFPNEADFKGQIVHPQFWPTDLDYSGKRIVVIGSGATAVTLVPALAQTAAHVTMLQRSPSYVVSRPLEDGFAQKLQKWLPMSAAHSLTRWKNVLLGSFFYRIARNKPEMFAQRLLHMVKTQVGPELDMKHFTPAYKPWDQRVCAVPDGDLFHDLRAGRASVVTDTIERFTADGIRLASGEELPADIIITATGLKLNALGDVQVSVDGQPIAFGEQTAYKGMMLSDIPNLILTFGYTNASWTLKAELTSNYTCRLLRYMDTKGYKVAVPRRGAEVQDEPFLNFTSGYVQRAEGMLPKQGDRKPWQVHQNYLQDKLTIQYGRLDDGVMQFQ
ncbi:NAD(P)/FAD-dependent oxidoreductase [Halopseudomonas laoshanensis]|uniref:NAD(P)/FAD-dependent oxidoreductase n=1 Tax=Halopseudomonas laoshanensis TaxID=2268758 RepID=A0A7V7GXL8_9GAMM|nr:NAD(P)/FAD-dependent oxidoreductase [Halopseudomonas laoshanensis]KAA0696874.1 NAD(P)/FAD-dependent oxidoreductase [Halopseudomonas laoshanensis]